MHIIVTILITVLIFGLLIFIHELGHFLFAKLFKVYVHEFALGMGPRILKKQGKETLYTLRLFPIGGFCAMEGEETVDDLKDDEPAPEKDSLGRKVITDRTRSFENKKIWQRLMIIVGGAGMNLVLGVVAFTILVSMQNLVGTSTIAVFSENAVSNEKLQVGDKISKINGLSVISSDDINLAFMRNDKNTAEFEVVRDNKKITLSEVPMVYKEQAGVRYAELDFKILGKKKNPLNVVAGGFLKSVSASRQVWISFTDLITGREKLESMSSIIGVGDMIGQAVEQSAAESIKKLVETLLFITGLISVNLGIFNLLPFPALDGGRVVFLLVEGVIRRPVNRKIQAYVNFAGLAALLLLMVFVTYNDIMRIFIK